MKNGDKVKIHITLETIIATPVEDISLKDIEDLIWMDDAYGLKSIIARDSDSEDDTQLFIRSIEVSVNPLICLADNNLSIE